MRLSLAAAIAAVALVAGSPAVEAQTQTVRMGWCARTVSSAAAPIALAAKLGWFEKMGIKVEVVPLPGSTDCVKTVATKDVAFALPSAEPILVIRQQGVDIRYFYTAGALDAMTRETMNVELQRIWMERRKTVLFITHSTGEAVFLADRVIVMTARPGRIGDVFKVDLPRPRPLEVMNTEKFGSYVKRIRDALNAGGGLD